MSLVKGMSLSQGISLGHREMGNFLLDYRRHLSTLTAEVNCFLCVGVAVITIPIKNGDLLVLHTCGSQWFEVEKRYLYPSQAEK